jgi:hypothetical protein
MTWRDYWNSDTPIYVNERHKALHYALSPTTSRRSLSGPGAMVLDHGCGEAYRRSASRQSASGSTSATARPRARAAR